MNANQKIARYLGNNIHQNVITSLVYRKKGQIRGRGDDRCSYGNDLVSVVLISGFTYKKVVQKSMDLLVHISAQDIIDEANNQGLLDKKGNSLTYPDTQRALLETWESFERSLNDSPPKENETYLPLEVEGTLVPGCKVYAGESKTCEKGTIYLQGIKIGEKIIEPSPHGPNPLPKSNAVALAKRIIRQRLPIGRYVSYALTPESEFDLRVGTSAGIFADQKGVVIRDEDLQKIKDFL